MRKWGVPGIPFIFSLVLSLSTIGTTVFWQDSGFYLTAVKEMGVLYPPGFVLYLVLCKIWTLLFFFLDFTLAVHLFSSFCAALAAGTLAVAARDLLRTRGPLFKINAEDPGEIAGWIGVAVGCLAACGYTFWFSGIYAKTYPLYYFALALLLWRMIRADESRKPRDYTFVAVLIGLAWAAHPSATNTGLALLLFSACSLNVLGVSGFLWRMGLGAACALGPSLFLPIFAARGAAGAFGNPATPGALFDYLLGKRFMQIPGAFGWDPTRGASIGLYFWEEFLGVGVILVTAGLVRLARANRRLLLGIAAWVVPVLLVTVLFKIEGQHDLWFVAAWLPLHLAAAAGLQAIVGKAKYRERPAVVALLLAGAAWGVTLNGPLLNMRGYDLAEISGRIYLEKLDRNAILLVRSDDSAAICLYLQEVKGMRPDVILVRAQHLERGRTGEPGWYDRALAKRRPEVKIPDYAEMRNRFRSDALFDPSAAAFANANVSSDRPVFLEIPPPAEMIRKDYVMVPAGALWKLAPRAAETTVDARYWEFPMTAEEARARFRRARGQFVALTPEGVRVYPEAYESRLVRLIVRARKLLADRLLRGGKAEAARDLFESILRVDPAAGNQAEVLYPLGSACYLLREWDKAEACFQAALRLEMSPQDRANALCYLGEIYRMRGSTDRAQRCFSDALAVPGVPEGYRKEIEKRAKKK